MNHDALRSKRGVGGWVRAGHMTNNSDRDHCHKSTPDRPDPTGMSSGPPHWTNLVGRYT